MGESWQPCVRRRHFVNARSPQYHEMAAAVSLQCVLVFSILVRSSTATEACTVCREPWVACAAKNQSIPSWFMDAQVTEVLLLCGL